MFVKETEKGIIIKKIEQPEKLMLEVNAGKLGEIAEIEPFSIKDLNLAYNSDFKIPLKKKSKS